MKTYGKLHLQKQQIYNDLKASFNRRAIPSLVCTHCFQFLDGFQFLSKAPLPLNHLLSKMLFTPHLIGSKVPHFEVEFHFVERKDVCHHFANFQVSTLKDCM
jgi:hypothetical protein